MNLKLNVMKTMKLIFLGLILSNSAFFSVNVFSQECKLKVNEIDKFTNQKKIETEPIIVLDYFKKDKIIKIKPISFQLKLENQKYILNLIFNIKSGTVMITDKEKLICILSNGETISLVRSNFMPSAIKSKSVSVEYSYEYLIEPEQLEMLLKYNITDVRVEAYMNPFDFQIMKDISTVKIFHCLK
jgi:hypothetical protein